MVAGTTVTVLIVVVAGLATCIATIVVLKVRQSKAEEISKGECITIDYIHACMQCSLY